MKDSPISYETKCENCEIEIEVMLYRRFAGEFNHIDGRSDPPHPPYNEPSECPMCDHPILIQDIEQKIVEHDVEGLERKEGL